MIRLLIFDFDGTIGNTQSIIVSTMQETLRVLELPEHSKEACAATIGLPLKECFTHLMPMNDETATLCETTYRRIFFEKGGTRDVDNIVGGYHKPGKVPVFPHVIETLKALHDRGMELTIASSRGHESLDDFVREMKLQPYIQYVLGAEDVSKAKPDAEPVLKTLSALGFQKDETMAIGDMTYDILMGRNAGVKTIGVTYGNGKESELREAGADFIINDFSELANII